MSALEAWAAGLGPGPLATGPVIGGILVGLWSWRAVFWFNLIFGALALGVAVISLPESANPDRRRVDLVGFVLVALVFGMVTFATIEGETAG